MRTVDVTIEDGQELMQIELNRHRAEWLSELHSWRPRREHSYVLAGWKKREACRQSWLDARYRYFDGAELRDELEDVEQLELRGDDARLTVAESRRRDRVALERVRLSGEIDRAEKGGWPFTISKEDASVELEEGESRSSSYAERLEWVSQNLDKMSATPLLAPCNASWSMLVWAKDNRKEFYAQQRQFLSKGEQEGEEQRAIERDFKRFDELIRKFACWKRFDGKLEGMGVYTEVERGGAGHV